MNGMTLVGGTLGILGIFLFFGFAAYKILSFYTERRSMQRLKEAESKLEALRVWHSQDAKVRETDSEWMRQHIAMMKRLLHMEYKERFDASWDENPVQQETLLKEIGTSLEEMKTFLRLYHESCSIQGVPVGEGLQNWETLAIWFGCREFGLRLGKA